MTQNNFKLIGIRPHHNCGEKFLKVLEPGRLYQFYNEYEFYTKDGKFDGINGEITRFEYKQIVPEDLYKVGNLNINISAIVGKNGTGKSTLTELLLYCVYFLGTKCKNDVGDEILHPYDAHIQHLIRANKEKIEDEPFLSIIPMIVYQVGDMYRIYRSLGQLKDEDLGEERLTRLMSFPIDLSLKKLSDWDELAIELVRGWEEKSGELENVRFLINKGIKVDELKNVGSWEEKSGELLKKRGRVLLSSLLLTILPISLEDLASLLGYRSKERYRDDYVKPLKDNGLIEYTIEQANDPNQKYQITQRGINFLMGSPI